MIMLVRVVRVVRMARLVYWLIGYMVWSGLVCEISWMYTDGRTDTSGDNLLHDQLPSECDYLRKILEFMVIILL